MPPRARKATTPTVLKSVQAEATPGRAVDFDVEGTIHALPDTHIQCRDFAHQWRPFTATYDKKARYYEVELKCSRCKTIRRRYIGLDGGLISSSYDYVDGYLIKGMGRLAGAERNMLRLESVKRLNPQEIAS